MDRKSPFSSVNHVAPGQVRISQAALEQPNNLIRDIMPGEWVFGQHNSIYHDRSSRRVLVDTYDKFIVEGSHEVIRSNPAIARVAAEVGGRAVFGYVANLSNLRNHLYNAVDLDLDDDVASRMLEERQRKFGAELLSGVVLREYGGLHYYGVAEFEQPAAEFTKDYTRFITSAMSTGTVLRVPSATRRIQRPKDVESSGLTESQSEPDLTEE